MIFAGILAGGTGERMNNGLPKQFIPVLGKPVLYYSLRRFCAVDQIGKIIISCHRQYVDAASRIADGFPAAAKITVIEGGPTRHGSLVNIIRHIREKGFERGDKIILHEAARPLVDTDLIAEHIRSLARFEATNTLFSAVDTMMLSGDGEFIDSVPPKKNIYHGQGPQGYDLAKLIHLLENEIDEKDLQGEPDLCAIYLRCRRNVKIIKGSEKLFKITYPNDLALLEYYLGRELQP